MPRRSPVTALSLLPCALLLAGCETFTPTLYRPAIDASLKLPCQPPVLPPEPASDNELAAFVIRQGKAFVDCSNRHKALVDRIDADGVKDGR